MLNAAIYHITHVDNLPGIIQAGCLWSDAQRIQQGFACTNIGYSHIKNRRLRRLVPVSMKGMLGDYVPFNFCYRSVMLYVIHRGHQDYRGGQESIVHLVSSVATAVSSGRPWTFTDRHADLGYAQYLEHTEQLNRIDWSVMPLPFWGSDSDLKEKRQAEFLVHDWFPWTGFERIGVHNRQIAAKVQAILGSAAHKPAATVEPGWYY